MAVDLNPIFELLDAYVQEFEPAIARDHLPDVVKTILPFLEVGRSLNQDSIPALVDQVVSLFDPERAQAKFLTDNAKATATTVAQTLTKLRGRQLTELVGKALQHQLGHVVSESDLPEFVKQLLPNLASLHLNQTDVPTLANQVVALLNPALAAQVSDLTQAVKVGRSLITSVIENFGSQQFVVDVLKSCAKNFVGGLITDADLPDVIKTIMTATDIKFNTKDGHVFIEQVAFTYKSGASGAFVMSSAQEIAQQLDREIQSFLANRMDTMHPTDVTQPIVQELPAIATSTTGLRPIEVRSTMHPSS
jgi:hypothetical protein